MLCKRSNHFSYLPSNWFTLVWTHPLSQIGNTRVLLNFCPSNQDNWMVPFTCYGSQCCLAPKCFLLEMKIFFGSLHFLWFQVLFSSNVFSIQNQHLRWFPPFLKNDFYCCLASMCFPLKINILGGSLPFTWFFVLFGSQCWLQYVFHSKSTFWVVPFTCYGSQCLSWL